MNHLKELELIAYFYGESSQPGEDRQHMETCGECAAAYEALTRDIALAAADIESEPIPERSAGYGEEVWRSLRPSLAPFESKRPNWFKGLLGSRTKLIWTLVSSAAVLALIAFLSGRLWEQKFSPHGLTAQGDASKATGNAPAQPVIVVLLSDHLERSERLLVELNHPDEAIVDPALQVMARQLLEENRRYRQEAIRVGSAAADAKDKSSASSLSGAQPQEKSNEVELSPAMTLTLEDLDRILAQVADQPGGLSRTEIAQVKQQINASGLLFEVRILRSRTRHAPTGTTVARREGTA